MADPKREKRSPMSPTAVVAIVVFVLFVSSMVTIYFLTRSDARKKIDALLDRRKEKVEAFLKRTGYSGMQDFLDTQYSSSYLPDSDDEQSIIDESYYPENELYSDSDGDTIDILDLDLSGYSYCSYLYGSFDENLEGNDEMRYDISDPQAMTDESASNGELRAAVLGILREGKERGVLKSYRYRVFKVPFMISGKNYYVESTLGTLNGTNVPYILSAEIGRMTALNGRSYRIQGEIGELTTVYLPVILFEETASYKEAYASRMLRNALILAILGLSFILLSFILERVLKKKTSEETPVEAVSVKEAPSGILTEERARDLLYHIELTEQSMGPNGYLEQLKEDIEKYAGMKKDEPEEE